MKTVLITGANHGLGHALADGFLDAGWRVIAIAREMPELPQGDNLQIELCDLTDERTISGLAARLQGAPIDVVINNAARYDAVPDDGVITTDYTQLTKLFQVNTIAPKLLADALVGNLHAGVDKLVVTMSSGMGTYAEFEEYHAQHWAYSASKAAVNYAMVSFAKLNPSFKSVLINPGWMQTAIGGSDAPLKPEESAEAIIDLIVNHHDKLPNARLVDYTGKHMDF
jgi:NAD(P)-dependent dehydrogenase (short-subunit alcohol dehydrogenase family)